VKSRSIKTGPISSTIAYQDWTRAWNQQHIVAISIPLIFTSL
jgi:hypothetical protein